MCMCLRAHVFVCVCVYAFLVFDEDKESPFFSVIRTVKTVVSSIVNPTETSNTN